MLSEQRQFEITELICREGKASISDLAEHFDVSCETIRRDLITISKGNRVRKVHGGAIAVRPHVQDDEYAIRQVQNSYNKRQCHRWSVCPATFLLLLFSYIIK